MIRSLTVTDVITGAAKMPFTSRTAWIATQRDCSDLRRCYSHLTQGTRPSKKDTCIRDVKRYIQIATVARDGLLAVREDVPFCPTQELIIVPRSVLHGLLTAIHIRFDHPTFNQAKRLFSSYFYALDLDKALTCVHAACQHCALFQSFPKHLEPQTSSPPPDRIGSTFAADVLKRYRQLVMVLRETVTSYTVSAFIESERHDHLHDAIIVMCSTMRGQGDDGICIRVYGAPGFTALVNDPLLNKLGISLEVGNPKNVNRNPVAERAIRKTRH